MTEPTGSQVGATPAQLSGSGALRQLHADASGLWKVTPATLATKISKGAWHPAEHLLHISQIVSSAIYKGFTVGGEDRIILNTPPRHGKSKLMSVWTPIWILEHWPWATVIIVSYGAELATDFSREARDIIANNEDMGGELTVRLRKDKRQVDKWMTTAGGGVIAAGVGGPIGGRGAHVLIIDDYIKNSAEAASANQRKVIFNWLVSTALTRLEPGAPALIIATRWHPDDAAGELDRMTEGPRWKTIKMPALAGENDILGRKPGEALWPARYNEHTLAGIRDTIGPYFWKALYQQDPQESRAGVFDGDALGITDIVPASEKVRTVRAWDLAGTSDEGGTTPAYTVGLKLAFDPVSGLYCIMNIKRERYSPDGVEKLMKDTAVGDGPDVHIYPEQEPGSAGKNLIHMLARFTLRGYIVRGVKVTGPKITRAQPVMAAIVNGTVRMLRADWNKGIRDEINAFPDGIYKDQVDALSLAYWAINNMQIGPAVWGRGIQHTGVVGRLSPGFTFGRSS